MTNKKTTSAGPPNGPADRSKEAEAVRDWEGEGGAAPSDPARQQVRGRRGNALTRMICRVFCPSSGKSKNAHTSPDAS
ncbi:hypothetical protein [Fodinicurvata fenggangensis]|uniref:hypothetical protein n=1 Tax=Fodinicurvata fenggangensis TaxID=1121830 RepID=UPI0004786FD3|nr:hypothetical protein [Fodinicurvata fenggangensis]